MVARFISGRSIEGALRYNEDKVKKKKAECLGAVGYPLDKDQLSFRQKLTRLARLAALNDRVKVNCVHVSLNFDPSEKMGDKRLLQIADAYIHKIGFAGQPYLVYHHTDAAHPHIHIVTTNIRPDGKRIALHNIGRNQSEQARKEIEQQFQLIPAESKKQEAHFYLKPLAAKAIIYGKAETKLAVSNVVREVIRSWKFTSLAEFNAILRRYNVMADAGEEESRMKQKGGLVYTILDKKGHKVGVPIKASAIYTKPTLTRLTAYFEDNKEKRKPYRDRIRNCIDRALEKETIHSKSALQSALAEEGINIIFRENEEGRIYGITFLDVKAKVVLNGSALGKNYTAAAILKRLQSDDSTGKRIRQQDQKKINEILKNTDFNQGFASVLAALYAAGIRISSSGNENDDRPFSVGYRTDDPAKSIPADAKLTAYLEANGFSDDLDTILQEGIRNGSQKITTGLSMDEFLTNIINDYFEVQEEYARLNIKLRKPKPKRRKPNW